MSTHATRTDPTKKAYSVWYYAAEDGKLLTDGWYTVDGEELYFAKNGACTRNGAVKVGDDKFYVEQGQGRKGTEQGWFSVDVEGSNGSVTTYWYYAKEDGSIYYGDWFTVDGHTVYFDTNGCAQLNRWFKIGEEWVCADKDGDRLGPGWVSLAREDTRFGVRKPHFFKSLAYFFRITLSPIAIRAQGYSLRNCTASLHFPMMFAPSAISSRKRIFLNKCSDSAISYTSLPWVPAPRMRRFISVGWLISAASGAPVIKLRRFSTSSFVLPYTAP